MKKYVLIPNWTLALGFLVYCFSAELGRHTAMFALLITFSLGVLVGLKNANSVYLEEISSKKLGPKAYKIALVTGAILLMAVLGMGIFTAIEKHQIIANL